MKHEIDLLIKDVKEGIYTRDDAQKKICIECLQHPSWECKRPCYKKKQTRRKYQAEPRLLPAQRQYHGVKLVIKPDNIEIIQRAQLDKIMIATIEPKNFYYNTWLNRRTSRYFYQECKRKYFNNVSGDGQLWIQHLSYKIGSEQSKRGMYPKETSASDGISDTISKEVNT